MWRSPTAIALMISLLGGCAQIDGWVGTDPAPERVLSGGFRTLSERYVQRVDFRKHAVSGLVRLADLDPNLDVAADGHTLTLEAQGRIVGAWPAPDPFDHDGWAKLATRFLAAARASSSAIRARSAEDVYSELFKGTLSGLDRYTRYTSARIARQRQAARDGFGGLGISINLTDGRVTIVKVFPNTPAAGAGLQPKDTITAINGKPVRGLALVDVVRLLRGPIDSRIDVTLERSAAVGPVVVSITRSRIVIPTVASKRNGALLVVTITGFNQGTASATRRQITEALRAEGPPVKGIVLDLRSNPGGLLSQSVRIADLFLNDGPIIRTAGRHRNSEQVFDATWGEIAPKMRLAVLVNGRSASASEIVAAALRDRGRAVVMGSSSYGKGSVQTIVGLPNGGELTLTWAYMITPAGYRLQDHGVIPALCTNGAPSRMEKLREALLKRGGKLSPFIITFARGTAASAPVGRSARDSCPPNANEPATDIEIARLVLSDERLYSRILQREMPAVASATGPIGHLNGLTHH